MNTKEEEILKDYTVLYEYDLSATNNDDVKAYYMVPNKNTETIEIETQKRMMKARAASNATENNMLEYNGIRYELSDEDTLVISGDGYMKNNIINDLIDYAGLYNDVKNYFSDKEYYNTYSESYAKFNENISDINRPEVDISDVPLDQISEKVKEYDYSYNFIWSENEIYPKVTADPLFNYKGTYFSYFSCYDEIQNDVKEYIDSIYKNYYISLPKTVIVNEGVMNVGYKAFYNCKSLEKVVLPDSLTSIDEYAFWNCTNLKDINLPNNLERIDNYGLYQIGIKSVTIPASCKYIGTQAFDFYNLYHNSKINSINYLGTFEEYLASNFNSYNLRSNKFGVKDGSIPVRFNFINDEIKTITINDEVINTGASLAYCTLPVNIEKIEISSLSNNFFMNTKNLKNVVLSSIQTISTNAFSYSDLENIEIPSGCNTIKSQAFNNCGKLKEVKLPSTVENIEKYAFSGLSNNSIIYCETQEVANLLTSENYTSSKTTVIVDPSMF